MDCVLGGRSQQTAHKVSAKTIQRILRHRNPSSTEKYVLSLNQDLHGVVNPRTLDPVSQPNSSTKLGDKRTPTDFLHERFPLIITH
jgi:hypothetical protein